MKYFQLNKFDAVNGEGVRVSLFISGCMLNCDGCFNKIAQNFNYGEHFTDEVFDEMMSMLAHPDVDGLSILGGEPLAPQNIGQVLAMCRKVKQHLPDKTIWLWTGYIVDDIKLSCPELFNYIDTIVDGPYVKELYSSKIQYRGSSNQRVINVKTIV